MAVSRSEPMFLLHPVLKEPLAEHILPLLSLEDLANLRASCRAMRAMVPPAADGFSASVEHQADLATGIMTTQHVMSSPFQTAPVNAEAA